MQEQDNEQNEQTQPDSDLQSTQSAVGQHNTKPTTIYTSHIPITVTNTHYLCNDLVCKSVVSQVSLRNHS